MDDSSARYCLKCHRKLSKSLVKKGRRLCDVCVQTNSEILAGAYEEDMFKVHCLPIEFERFDMTKFYGFVSDF